MLDEDQVKSAQAAMPDPKHVPDPDNPAHGSPDSGSDAADASPATASGETIIEELGALIDDAGLYVTAELAFQRTRAALAGKSIAIAAAAIIVAVILLHIALVALAVGFVIALAPLVTIWGAIAIVVGAMLLGVAALCYVALARGRLLAEMFAGKGPANSREDSAP